MTGLNRTTNSRLLAGLLALAVGSAGLVWWVTVRGRGSDGFGEAIRVEPIDEGFVGSRTCADCHRKIWEKFQGHPMAHSLASVQDALPIEDYVNRPIFTHPETRQYRVERAGNRVEHHEIMTDREGNVLYDQAVEVQYAVGSGKRGRSYLLSRGGLFYTSPIAWYSTTGAWDAAPGYQPLSHPRFERRANDKCLSCHAGRLAYDRRFPDRYGDPPFLEAAIGCERCHGPGAAHVRRQTTGDDLNVADTIVNPMKLDVAARGDICNQCHLQGDVRILRNGRSIHDFRAGQRLEDVWAVFVGEVGVSADDTTRAVNQVDQMRASVCFQASAGRLECISCHDPHGVPSETGRTAFFNERCLNCHHERGCILPAGERAAPPADGSCIACHMRPLVARNVPHTSQTDHRIPRLASAPPASRPRRELRFFDGSDARLPPDEVERARVLGQLLQLNRQLGADAASRLALSLLPIAERHPDDVELLEAIGILFAYQDRPADAERLWRQALHLRPLDESVLQHLAVLQSRLNMVQVAISTSRQILRANPWRADYHVRLAQLLEESGDIGQAVVEAELGLQIDPSLVPVREWLVQAYRQTGRIDDARREQSIIDRMRNR